MEYMLFSTDKYKFFQSRNPGIGPEIPGFGLCQSRDSGLRKTSGIPGFGTPGLQSLVNSMKI